MHSNTNDTAAAILTHISSLQSVHKLPCKVLAFILRRVLKVTISNTPLILSLLCYLFCFGFSFCLSLMHSVTHPFFASVCCIFHCFLVFPSTCFIDHWQDNNGISETFFVLCFVVLCCVNDKEHLGKKQCQAKQSTEWNIFSCFWLLLFFCLLWWWVIKFDSFLFFTFCFFSVSS